MDQKHDLTTAAGVFGYFAEHTKILEPVQAEFERIQAENEALKAENEQTQQDKTILAQNLIELTTVVETLITILGGE